jgi:hypothetical protein
MDDGSLMRPLLFAPLPGWVDMFFAFFGRPAQDRKLAGPWCRPGDEPYVFSRSSWSLAVIARWRQLQTSKETVTVWLPDYFCNSALGPLRDIGAHLIFYPVNDGLTLDPDACERLADISAPDIVVLVHYFGQPAQTGNIPDICKRHGAWLIEDAAHVLCPVPGIGETGDCVLYSPHKHLPIPDGAMLIVRRDGPACLGAQPSAMSQLRQLVAAEIDRPRENDGVLPNAVLWLIKRTLQRVGVRYLRGSDPFLVDPGPAPTKAANPQMSVLGRRMLSRLLPSIGSAGRLREERALDWQHLLSCFRLKASYLLSTTTPYLAGFSCEQESGAMTMFEELQRNGFPIMTWPDLPPEVSQCPKRHGVAILLRRTRFYLPIHQSLKRHQILALGKKLLESVTQQWCLRSLIRSEWEAFWRQCSQSNLLQSWQYGVAKEEAEGWRANRFLISDDAGNPVALAQVLSRDLPLLGGVARLNRGPIIIGSGEIPHHAGLAIGMAAMCTLLREASRRHWWMLQFAPELPSSISGEFGLRMLGFRKLKQIPWESALMPLEACEQELLMRLNGKWRNCMRKGEKMGVLVTRHRTGCNETRQLLRGYRELQNNRGFAGLSDRLIRALIAQRGSDGWRFNIFIACDRGAAPDSEPLGMLITIESGSTALYLMGLTNNRGRRMQANSVLLWQAILHAKNEGCKWFDVGGLGEATPPGIAEFKRGLNGEPYKSIGEWWKLHGF